MDVVILVLCKFIKEANSQIKQLYHLKLEWVKECFAFLKVWYLRIVDRLVIQYTDM